jgi:hypothetical protein
MKKTMRTAALAAAVLAAGAAWGASQVTAKKPGAPKILNNWVGYRKMSIPLPGTQTVFLHIGDRTDMIVEFEAELKDGSKQKVAATVLQNVVISDLVRPKEVSGVGAVEVLVNPNEAQYAALSIAQGEVHIVKRAPQDDLMKPMEIASFRKLFK